MLTLAVLASIAASGGPPARDLFDEVYRRGQEKNGNLRTFTATFEETTTSSLLTRPLQARGTVAVERPGRVALHYTEPDERQVIIDGNRMTLTWPSRGIRQTKDIGASQRRVQKYFVDSSPDELRSHFQVTAREVAEGYAIEMVPRRKQISEGVARLDLTLDGASLLMTTMRMTFPNGGTKTMTFRDVRPDGEVDPALFRVPDRATP